MGISGFFKNVIGFVAGGSAMPVSAENPLPTALPALGSALDTAATNSTGTWTGLAVLKGIWQGISDFSAKSGQMYTDNTTLQYSGQNTTVDFNLSASQKKARLHQVFIDSRNVARNGPATTGSVAIWFKAVGSSNWEQLLDETNTAMTVTLATPRTFRFEIAVSAIRFVATGMTAGEDYTPCIVGEF